MRIDGLLLIPIPKFRNYCRRDRKASVKRRGFTLLELLIVIVVIGILGVFLFAALGRARRQGYIVGCASNLRQIGTALVMYADDHGNDFPPDEDDLHELYPNYIDDLHVFACPATKTRITNPAQLRATIDPANGIIAGMDYEYRGTAIIGDGTLGPAREPTLVDAEQYPTRYLLAWDNDNYGINRVIDKLDNHGAAGGNKLFSDGSVRWYRAAEWGVGE